MKKIITILINIFVFGYLLLPIPSIAINLPSTSSDHTTSASLTSPGTVPVQVNGTSSVLISATGTGTGLSFSFQCYDGVNWILVNAYPISSGTLGSPVTSGTANGDWLVNSGGCAASSNTGIRVNLTAISGGTETFSLNSSAATNNSALALESGNLATTATNTNTTNTNLGAPGSTVCSSDTGSCNINAFFQRLAQKLTTINSTLNAPMQSTGGTIQPVPATTGGNSYTSTQVPNNTTAVVIKGSAGQVYGVRWFSNSATIAYVKVYNATSATCGSGTPVDRFMIQPNSNGGWLDMMGEIYSTGITVCVTLGYADSDTTAPAANAYSYTVIYK